MYQRADDKWVAQVEAGKHPNGRRRVIRAVRATKADALKAMKVLQRQAETGVVADSTRSVKTYLDWWADNVLAGTVKASTEVDYRNVCRLYIEPHIGHVRLGKLTPAQVQGMMRKLEEQGLSARTRQYARAVLVRALRWAEQTGMVTRNVAAVVDGPRLGRAAKLDDALTAEQVRTVLAAARGDRLEALAHLVLRLGLRRGEALALRWDNVDFDRKELVVAGTLKYADGKLYVDTPKTAAGHRTLPLLEDVAAVLKAHRKRQAAEQLKAGFLWQDSGHVFTTERGEPVRPSFASYWWPQLCRDAGLGHRRFHATRHTAATLLLDQGVPLEVVSAILGHASLAITSDVYAKVTQDSKRKALGAIDFGTGT